MKTRHIILFVFSSLLLPSTIKAQAAKTDSVFWENGNVSFLSELNSVWIILKKGSDLKGVRIREIKKDRGVLVYEKDKCLHDVYIHNIKRIQAGKNSKNAMFFYADNTPYIKLNEYYADPNLTYTEFKSVEMPPREISQPKIIESVPVNEPKAAEKVSKEIPFKVSTGCDTIVDVAGNVTLAKITDITPRLISFRKISNPDGPIYIKSVNNAEIIRYTDCVTIRFIEKK